MCEADRKGMRVLAVVCVALAAVRIGLLPAVAPRPDTLASAYAGLAGLLLIVEGLVPGR